MKDYTNTRAIIAIITIITLVLVGIYIFADDYYVLMKPHISLYKNNKIGFWDFANRAFDVAVAMPIAMMVGMYDDMIFYNTEEGKTLLQAKYKYKLALEQNIATGKIKFRGKEAEIVERKRVKDGLLSYGDYLFIKPYGTNAILQVRPDEVTPLKTN
jgi:hypothetical protein